MRALLVPALLAGCAQTIRLKDPPPPATIGEACDTLAPTTTAFPVRFPAREASCDWGEDENLDPEQGVVTARAEDVASIDLQDAAICDVGFTFDVGEDFRYDDAFLLLFGDVVLAASYGSMVEVFDTDGALRLYDWSKLAGYPLDYSYEGPYCLGEAEGLSACSIPPPETTGDLALDFGATIVDALAERVYRDGRYDFRFVTLGDNDPDEDCSHSGFRFTVDVTYVPF